ncbi:MULTISPECIES: peptide deformylase [unclassified Carboxylicivirga]|uniref:peptide deformylase n=1 Tax=Carboxylicivirga TaxID=1628153 RepID=UPI003D3295EF
MILPVALYGNPVLCKKAAPVLPDDQQISQLIKDLWATLYRTDGIGLAAPQVGHSLQLFVVDLDVYKDEHPELKGFKKVFINPQLEVLPSRRVWMTEGCLSLPGISRKVKRSDKVRIHYYDEQFVAHEEVYAGFAARVIQHEYDHLEGCLFIDRLGRFKRFLLQIFLRQIRRGKCKPAYRVIQ